MNIFQNVKNPSVPRNTFDLSHDHKFTCDMGQLIPAALIETYPGDLFKIRTQVLARTLALLSPVMHLIDVDVHWYKAPLRIMYPDIDDILAPPDPDDTPPLPPTFNYLHGVSVGDLGDYLGLPIDASTNVQTYTFVAYPVIMYSRIYDYWYRDQNLQAEATGTVTAGALAWADTMVKQPPLKRAWGHDYFTSSLPFAQKGDVVTLPLIENASGAVDVTSKGAGNVTGNILRGVSDFIASTADDVVSGSSGTIEVGAQGTHTIDPNGDWEVQLNTIAQDIITVRTAFKVQEFLELDARAGTRYKEVVYSHFDVNTKDGRLMEPEYIGGQKSQIKISEVLSTAQTLNSSNTVVNPVGEMSGHGISYDNGKTITTYCREHGYLMAIFSARPRTAYQQGVHKLWTRKERLDYPWPMLAHVGEQPVYGYELYTNLSGVEKMDTVFGYIPRYSELKFINSRVSGLMQTTFDYWHLGRIFTSEPALNSDFIECDPDKRVFAVTTEPSLLVHMIFNIQATRNFPMFSTPKL
jgi:hypothetical protein